jgi:hypothetical protein
MASWPRRHSSAPGLAQRVWGRPVLHRHVASAAVATWRNMAKIADAPERACAATQAAGVRSRRCPGAARRRPASGGCARRARRDQQARTGARSHCPAIRRVPCHMKAMPSPSATPWATGRLIQRVMLREAGNAQQQPDQAGDQPRAINGTRCDQCRLGRLRGCHGAGCFHGLHRKRRLVQPPGDHHRHAETEQHPEGARPFQAVVAVGRPTYGFGARRACRRQGSVRDENTAPV